MTEYDLLPTDLDRIAAVVAEQGFDAVDPGLVDAVVHRALARGASITIAEVAADTAEPAVARLRAFGRLAVAAARPAPDRLLTAA
ncbi:MAG: hypothetical protein CL424_01150 [Acidimicrobiaceae bacterium]|nr:hypothetical protein [Acidimicrobiaceae bacterium]